jgi:hypothetical protein
MTEKQLPQIGETREFFVPRNKAHFVGELIDIVGTSRGDWYVFQAEDAKGKSREFRVRLGQIVAE